MADSNKIWRHNAVFWDQEALAQKPWSQPVSKVVDVPFGTPSSRAEFILNMMGKKTK